MDFYREIQPQTWTGISVYSISGNTTVNVLPFPRVLSSPMVPFIASTSRFVIASPNPVPPYFLELSWECCRNDSKISLKESLGIPMPVSITFISSFIRLIPDLSRLWYAFTLIRISPWCVNLTAFPTRLISIWRSLISSNLISVGKSLSSCSHIINSLNCDTQRKNIPYLVQHPTDIKEGEMERHFARLNL